MTRTQSHLLRLFVTGLLAALPLAATVAVFWWAVSLLLRWVGPDSAIGSVLKAVGLGVTGSEVAGWLIGLAAVAGALVLLGAMVERGLQRGMAAVIDTALRRVPLVHSVYDLIRRMVALFRQRDEDGVRAMAPVWCHFGGLRPANAPAAADTAADAAGPRPGVSVLALLSSPQPVMVGGRRCLALIVPTAPVPVGGGLLYVPEDWVEPAAIGMEALTSIYVSMGVTSPQYLPASPSATLPGR